MPLYIKPAADDFSDPERMGTSPSDDEQTISAYRIPESIPRRIIQTGKTMNLPLLERAAVSNIKTLNPDFDYRFFDDRAVEKFMTEEYPQYRTVFDNFPHRIQKYDFFRYLAIHRYGGFYFDLDVLVATGLEPLLETGCIFSFGALTVSTWLRDVLGMDWLLGNYAFGATAGHPFLSAIIDNCVRAQRDPEWLKPMRAGSPLFLADEFLIINSTGPGLVSRTFAENPEFVKTVSVLFPEDVSDLRNWNCFGEYGVHLMRSSWRVRKNYVRHKLSDFSWRWIQHRNVLRARGLGKRRASQGRLESLSGLSSIRGSQKNAANAGKK